MHRALQTNFGRARALELARKAPAVDRRYMIEGIQRLNGTTEARRQFISAARRALADNPDDIARRDNLVLALLYSEEHAQTWRELESEQVKNTLDLSARSANFLGARVSLGFELARYREVVATAKSGIDQSPELLRSRIDYLKSSFAAGKLDDTRMAIELFGRQFRLIEDHPGRATDLEIERIIEACQRQTLHTVDELRKFEERRIGRKPTMGVFFLSSTEALGHAILDPFYFVALNRNRFDKLVFIGPPRANYRSASRACLQIVEQYGDYIETGSDSLMNLSWMSLGHHEIDGVTLVIDHYWELLRRAVHQTRDASDAFEHNAWHFRLPEYYNDTGESFCARAGIDLERPLVVLHVRDKGYHGIAKQSFRDSAVENYREAVEHMLSAGYQVVRIGDDKMPKLQVDHPSYFELPFLGGYRHELDPFLISRSRFMIGCQSGPCAFARALGVPILTVNAVLHYTLLPSSKEMACFKRYYKDEDGTRRELTIEEAIDSRIYHFENSYQFEEAGVEVENASPEEIVASVKDMMAWLDQPALQLTPEQSRFAERVEKEAKWLAVEGPRLSLPIADYLGICLDGYRISPSVARMREAAKPAHAVAEPAPIARPAAPAVAASSGDSEDRPTAA